MNELINLIKANYGNALKMSLFNYIKTGNYFYDTIISTVLLSIVSYIVSYFYENNLYNFVIKVFSFNIKSLLFAKNTIILEGKRSMSVGPFDCRLVVSSVYSNRFKAILSYIIENVDKNDSICRIKEFHTNFNSSNNKNQNNNHDIYMVYQNAHFVLDKNIFVKAIIEQEENENEEKKSNVKTDKITIDIYSYVYSINKLKDYVDNITNIYLRSIKNNRFNKQFIYSLNSCNSIKDDDNVYSNWSEELFESSRTFNNIFFDGKTELLERINYFLEQREWYFEMGIPYSLGIGLHGRPGTGKTSFIKALANYTKRHIVCISLKLIKTKQQLEQIFFENTYNSANETKSITFDKKIIVFEDIDCVGDIIFDRNRKINDINDTDKTNHNEYITIGNVLKNIYSNANSSIANSSIASSSIANSSIASSSYNGSSTNILSAQNRAQEEPITLDDILNLWDGIRETPGRIIIITSNFYDKLDFALTRPGRIDITHEFTNASHNTITEMYKHFFKKDIDKNVLTQINNLFYSPAELINIYVSNKDEDKFIERLLKNTNV